VASSCLQESQAKQNPLRCKHQLGGVLIGTTEGKISMAILPELTDSNDLAKKNTWELHRRRASEILKFLRETYPEAFASQRARPLVVGTHLEIRRRHPDLEHGPLALALRWHCQSKRYIKAVARRGSHRYDLAGNPVEPVSKQDRDFATARLANEKPPAAAKPATVLQPKPDTEPPPPTRPILKLKKPAGTIAKVTVVRREVKP
jgi:sRNA-binding protein